MTHDEITQSMCRASMWQGFAEKIEKANRIDKLIRRLVRWQKKPRGWVAKLENRYCQWLHFRLCKYGVNNERDKV